MGATITTSDDHAAPAADFRHALRHFASGVTVVTTRDVQGTVHGMTATAFTSLSLRPPMVLIAIARTARCHAQILAAGRFGISILHDRQTALSQHFGGTPAPGLTPRFRDIGGVAVVEAALVALACRLEAAMDGGDHTIFTAEVERAEVAAGAPLIHYDSHYHMLGTQA